MPLLLAKWGRTGRAGTMSWISQAVRSWYAYGVAAINRFAGCWRPTPGSRMSWLGSILRERRLQPKQRTLLARSWQILPLFTVEELSIIVWLLLLSAVLSNPKLVAVRLRCPIILLRCLCRVLLTSSELATVATFDQARLPPHLTSIMSLTSRSPSDIFTPLLWKSLTRIS